MRAAIPMPSICRAVVVSRKDGEGFVVGSATQAPMVVTEAPAIVVGVERDEDLAILVMLGANWLRCPHRDLVPVEYPGETLVWHWPPRA